MTQMSFDVVSIFNGKINWQLKRLISNNCNNRHFSIFHLYDVFISILSNNY